MALFILTSLGFYVGIELLMLVFRASLKTLYRYYIILKTNNLVFVGESHYYNFYFTDDKNFWILQYSNKPKCFRFYKWEEYSDSIRDSRHFYCNVGQIISGTLFYLVSRKIENELNNVEHIDIGYDIKNEERVLKAYKQFKIKSRRRNIVSELTQ